MIKDNVIELKKLERLLNDPITEKFYSDGPRFLKIPYQRHWSPQHLTCISVLRRWQRLCD
jgi:hypothetical protein